MLAAARGDAGLYVVALGTGRINTVTRRGKWLHPVWSPDGTRLAFVRGGALFVVDADGRGERRLATGVPDESWQPLSWSGDGRVVFFEKQRAGEGDDIWRVSADGRAAKALTRAFPTGADFTAPRWASTTIDAPPRAPRTRWLALKPTRVLETPWGVKKLSADAGRAAIEASGVDTCGPIGIWAPGAGISWIAGSRCEEESQPEDHYELVLAGRYAAWTRDWGGFMPEIEALQIGTVGTDAILVDQAEVEGGVRHDGGRLAGDGALLVYNSWVADYGREGSSSPPVLSGRRLWRILPTGKRALLTSGADAGDVVSVDAGRIAVLRPDGMLAILDQRGRRLSAFRLRTRDITGLKLTGTRLVVLRGATLEVRDAAPGTLRHRWHTAAVDTPITLDDAQGDFAVYTAGIAIHVVRLSDGRDRVLSIADEQGPVCVDLEPEGLYYSYSRPGSSRPGRLAFVSGSELRARFH